jgi:uncharacterized protein
MPDYYFPDHYFIVAFFTFLLAGFVKGVIGMGLPTVSVGLLSLVVAPVEAAALMVVPSFATNLWQAVAGRHFRDVLRRLWSMFLGIGVGTWMGSGLLIGDGTVRTVAALGIALALYALLGLSKVQFAVPRRAERWASPIAGAITGVVTGATGIFVIPSAPYIQALGMDKDWTVQAFGFSFTVSTVALAAALTFEGAYEPSVAGTSALALLPAAIGMVAGQWIRARVSASVFRLCFFIGTLLLGLHLAVRAFL